LNRSAISNLPIIGVLFTRKHRSGGLYRLWDERAAKFYLRDLPPDMSDCDARMASLASPIIGTDAQWGAIL
jgi:hypothetical protein